MGQTGGQNTKLLLYAYGSRHTNQHDRSVKTNMTQQMLSLGLHVDLFTSGANTDV